MGEFQACSPGLAQDFMEWAWKVAAEKYQEKKKKKQARTSRLEKGAPNMKSQNNDLWLCEWRKEMSLVRKASKLYQLRLLDNYPKGKT